MREGDRVGKMDKENRKEINFRQIERKWQAAWQKEKIFEPEPSDKEKFFIVVAYPYPSGAMHVGHARTYVFPDILARYKRLRGYNVLLPMGWHVTGTPVLAACEKIKERDPEQIRIMTEVFRIPKSDLNQLEEPRSFVKYFVNKAETGYKFGMRGLGISIDWRRELTTIDPQYNKFIEWQYIRLHEKGYVIQKEYPVRYCPRDKQPVGDHDLKEGEGVGIAEFTLLKFKFGNDYLVAATLRPETIFGQTNFWANPDVVYVRAKVNGENWIISKECAEKLRYQNKKVELIGEISGRELIGKKCIAPLIERELLILPAKFVDPDVGTGLVTSVPSDAPYDWIALKELQENEQLAKRYGLDINELRKIKPIPIIKTEGMSDLPAVEMVEKYNIVSQSDPRLEQLTREVYKSGYYKGVMNENCGEYAGLPVEEAKEKIKTKLIKKGLADVFYELERKPVICRCGAEVVVAILPDQWFLKYSDANWKKQVRAHFKEMHIVPELYRPNFEHTIDWLEDKPCTRLRGLGTKLPFDKRWIIEPLADSTIYFAYFTISHLIKNVPAEKLAPEVFDYIFLGKGDPKKLADEHKIDLDLLKQMRASFDYWYPLDYNISASELIPNHMTFTIFHHVALFPPKKRLRGEICLGMGTLEGQKMSSSKGNVILVSDLLEELGADMSRFFLMNFVEPWEDFDWRSRVVRSALKTVKRFYETLFEYIDKGEEKELDDLDNWILSRLHRTIKEVTELMDNMLFRKTLQLAVFEMHKDLKWYERRGGNNKKVFRQIVSALCRILAPFTPHICEELWHALGNDNFVSCADWPEFDEAKIRPELEERERMIEQILEDVRKIIQLVAKKGAKSSKLYLYCLPSDYDGVNSAKEFFARETRHEVFVYSVADKEKYDPQNKAAKAKPGKPAIYLE